MAESLLPTYSMESKRILHSTDFWHELELSEQSMQVILHALHVLRSAFDQEPEYLKIIDTAREDITSAYRSDPSRRP